MVQSTSQPSSAGRPSGGDPRPTVYLDRDVLTAPEPNDDRRRRRIQRRLLPGAVEALRHLAEARFEVVMLGPVPVESLVGLGITVRFEHTVASHDHATWVVTADPAWCERERPGGVRTILVGPRRPPGRRPTAHCDIEARDLSAAVIEILAREAMVG